MTFSLRPSSVSDLPLTAASVSTRVVSWNEAAEMNERVCSDAFEMPSSTGFEVAGRLPCFSSAALISTSSILSICSHLQQVRIAGIVDLDLLQHHAHDHFDVLVVDGHALQTVDVLDFVDEEVRQLFDALDGQDVVRRRVAVEDVVALLDAVAMLHGEALAARHEEFERLFGIVAVRMDDDLLLVLVVLAELDRAGDLGEDGVILRTPRLEQFRHARQTARDVAGLGRRQRHAREHVAGLDLGARLDRQHGLDRQQVASIDAARDLDGLAALAVLDEDAPASDPTRAATRASR